MIRAARQRRVWGNISRYKFKSIFVRNIITNIAFIAVPLILISGILHWNSTRIVKNEISELSRNTLIRNRDLFDALLKKADYVSATFALMSEVFLFTNPSEDSENNRLVAQEVLDNLKPFVLADPHIDSIYIFSEKQNRIITLSGVFILDDFRDNNWMESYRNSHDTLPYRMNRVLFDDYLPVISVIKPIRNQPGGELQGAVIINLSLDNLTGTIVSDGRNEELSILDNNNRILFSENFSQIGYPLESLSQESGFSQMLAAGETVRYLKKGGLLLVTTPSSMGEMTYMMKIPLEHYEAKFHDAWVMFFILLLVSFLISLTASLILALNNYRPIDRLLEFVDNPQKAGETLFKSEEIKEIAASILTTVHLNENLKEELMEQLSLVEKTRISALQAQINPHFLYNTLDTIRWEAMELTGGENEVGRMLAALARLFRLSLETSGNTVAFRDEAEHAALFLRLLNHRYPDKFEIIWDIDPELNCYLVLKLSLQPIIENAWIHGIKPTRRPGRITIKGRLLKERVLITVEDNGQGLIPEELERLNRIISEDLDLNDQHIGLKNVNQRIKLVFGSDYGLSLKHHPGGGTEVELSFPRRKEG
ncbi:MULTISPECIES: sensor histidine kinase [unclassified Oceanispirochaeta]|uniref:sensor histidine kinase n=1 Tax=unclassified Oceanispirochaeta TaxID=2635722 RepID=UPI000E09CEF8|nr:MULTISPECIES: histidine kinase [unclassified Oceanispirochaeta]MBF9014607.1 histidine kinase [Oceanispirochaeta sp. M2]NPD70863.1 histidine kinase [Oceanispirochaeta sp. M1]RDG34142.1 hypothetical protein DV872_02015 [Oceanispirochaeta sp. M1]